MKLPCEVPILQAPMAGGPSTPALTAAVAAAGGYGFVAGGYVTAAELERTIAGTRALSGAPFGVNLFVPSTPAAGAVAEVGAYARLLQPEAERLGVALGEPRWEDDDFDAKVEVLEAAAVHLASFTFGCPTPAIVDRLHRAGVTVAVTVTSAPEGHLAEERGADLLLAQGTEAGGHQGSFIDLAPNTTPLLSLLAELGDTTPLPVVATGGVMTGEDIASALRAGAIGVQLGTAFLCTPEAGTSPPYRAAVLDGRYADTIVTRAYTGRYARGLANRFAIEHDGEAPGAYPEVHHLTRPLRAAATRAGDADVPNLWAGTGWRQVTAQPAGAIVRRLAGEAQRAGR